MVFRRRRLLFQHGGFKRVFLPAWFCERAENPFPSWLVCAVTLQKKRGKEKEKNPASPILWILYKKRPSCVRRKWHLPRSYLASHATDDNWSCREGFGLKKLLPHFYGATFLKKKKYPPSPPLSFPFLFSEKKEGGGVNECPSPILALALPFSILLDTCFAQEPPPPSPG